MGEALLKLRPDRDLQCYFEQPSAIAALSSASETGFTVSGAWRQQFDWCVIEWNRDNGFEHPAFRNLPDGDLSGLTLSYDETRENCVPVNSDLYPWVDWPNLRVWTEGRAEPYRVELRPLAMPVEGEYLPARAEFELTGTLTPGDYIGLSWADEQYNHLISPGESLETAVSELAAAVDALSPSVRAESAGAKITLISRMYGANANRLGAYGFVSGARTERWTPEWSVFAGGESPVRWNYRIPFGSLVDTGGAPVPTSNVRKLRWTYAAEMQRGAFERTDFAVRVTNWSVSGTGREYRIPGPGSRRIEDDDATVEYSGTWERGEGNYSGGSVHATSEEGATATFVYTSAAEHWLYAGVIRNADAGMLDVIVDGGATQSHVLHVPGEQFNARVPLGVLGPGEHSVFLRRSSGKLLLDFLEVGIPESCPPEFPPDAKLTLATDWDTEHSLAIAPERTAWMIDAMGFRGRVNHYVGAMWFYELVRKGHEYASASITFSGIPEFGGLTTITIGRLGDPNANVQLMHLHNIGETTETLARAFELAINRGSTAIRAEASGNVLRLHARAMGTEGNGFTLEASPGGYSLSAETSGTEFTGGTNGEWRTDVAAIPRLNRAARDWHRAFFAALRARGLDATAAFSLELRDGDPSEEAGIAQRCPEGDAVILNTPALQTNFSPESRAFWRLVYAEMAGMMAEAGMVPYIQFGEVQWWYFRDGRSGMPYYDAYTKARFESRYGREIGTITDWTANPELHPDEAEFLPELIGEFTTEVLARVREQFPDCRAEVLYPLDVNDSDWNRTVNYPVAAWTAESLDCLKTESFGYTYSRDLDRCMESIRHPFERGFGSDRAAHLIGLSDSSSPWNKEAMLAASAGVESVVLFALDQFCLIGYPLPTIQPVREARFDG